MYGDLRDMLSAWVVARRDEGLGYVHGVAKIAAMFLLNMRPPEGFLAMRNLLERHCMRAFFGGIGTKDDVSPLLPSASAWVHRIDLFSAGRSKLITGNPFNVIFRPHGYPQTLFFFTGYLIPCSQMRCQKVGRIPPRQPKRKN